MQLGAVPEITMFTLGTRAKFEDVPTTFEQFIVESLSAIVKAMALEAVSSLVV